MLTNFHREDDNLNKKERKSEIDRLRARLAGQQQTILEAKIPVVVLVEGWDCAGKGNLINELICEMDPRFYSVAVFRHTPEREDRFPFLRKFFQVLPEDGKLLFVDTGWMEDTVGKLLRREIPNAEYKRRVESCQIFERQLRDNGYVVIKLFMHISQEEQRRRMTTLWENRDTSWRVSEEDFWQQQQYPAFLKAYDQFMEDTNKVFPWHVLDAQGKNKYVLEALRTVSRTVDKALENGRYEGKPTDKSFPLLGGPSLKDADLNAVIDVAEYKKELKRLQGKLRELHNQIYRKRIPVVLCYEGWDAAGKGGNIRRIAYPLDPRGFDVIPVASPTPGEKARHFLWRFWTKLPKSGHVTIFDRTWYGRVMVERIEGFCSENDWKRAYGEINEFEKELTDYGTVVLKFWINIDPQTQLERFTARQNTPEKQWKITDEDWRNREKWPLYEEAVEEMLRKTSTTYAPWYIIDSVDKRYARIQTLKIVTDVLEKAVNDCIIRGIESEWTPTQEKQD
ncbi:MAG: polyphosphate:AMP phosphotransferase [Oscillospiraceae bacterium]|nr:polyphosphate:AMP phosphotransferase [Oscillospiraceae bacterium]MBR6208349.1 polyphosphate:AMP phosphotransferase [Oscillospiraceae bacterium]